ncbi:hypothetical protein GCM10010384_63870 [Streptomyces djakartensis]|uniref:Uncharacterized protein n=1 Tax=Streptomyces djakartensis TaxID=68193 RepID=A0ABQ3AF76_9ACTN|nr:hypothetical protein GCM10010384_63870 [Streptomyces djakartensis]
MENQSTAPLASSFHQAMAGKKGSEGVGQVQGGGRGERQVLGQDHDETAEEQRDDDGDQESEEDCADRIAAHVRLLPVEGRGTMAWHTSGAGRGVGGGPKAGCCCGGGAGWLYGL